MQENYELVQWGYRTLVGSMSSYIGQTLHRIYKDKWWDRICLMLNDQRDLPYYGDYGDLIDSLDVANCLRIITRMWKDDFSAALVYQFVKVTKILCIRFPKTIDILTA